MAGQCVTLETEGGRSSSNITGVAPEAYASWNSVPGRSGYHHFSRVVKISIQGGIFFLPAIDGVLSCQPGWRASCRTNPATSTRLELVSMARGRNQTAHDEFFICERGHHLDESLPPWPVAKGIEWQIQSITQRGRRQAGEAVQNQTFALVGYVVSERKTEGGEAGGRRSGGAE